MEQRLTLADLQQKVGQHLGTSDWILVDQARINAFADCTDDHQWIHVDEARAAKESPYGQTIAHGFLTLSLLSPIHMHANHIPIEAKQVINYGLDRVRFMNAVKSGQRIRGHVKLVEVKSRGRGMHFIKTENTIEIEGEKKPALTADLIVLIIT
ncbi:MAG: MaoC family dehydratase [Gammaproteobacteria bacterium]|nr:MAG: MaoC family dehydratase [Gammaproteobacteria bacterium]